MLDLAGKINQVAPILIIIIGLIRLNISASILGVILLIGYQVDFADHSYNWYYIFCGAINYAALEISNRMKKPDYNLLLTVYLFIYLNLLGWFYWMSYISGDLYTILCAFNYAFITFLIIGGKDGAFKLDIRNYFFYIPDDQRLYNFSCAKKEERA